MHVYTRIYVERPLLRDVAFERGRLCGGYFPWDPLYTYLHIYIYSGEPAWSDLTFERVPLCSLDIHFNTCMHVYTRIYVERPILSNTRHWRSFCFYKSAMSQFAQISAYYNAWAFVIVRWKFERLFSSKQLFSRPFFSYKQYVRPGHVNILTLREGTLLGREMNTNSAVKRPQVCCTLAELWDVNAWGVAVLLRIWMPGV